MAPADGESWIKDSVGRTIPSLPPPTPAISGCPSPAAPNQLTVSSSTWNVPGPNGVDVSYLFCYTTVHFNLDFQFLPLNSDTVPMFPQTTFDETALQSVVLPNGTYWEFSYASADPSNSSSTADGDVTSIRMPSGASINYQFYPGGVFGIDNPQGGYRMVRQRSISDPDGQITGPWNFTWDVLNIINSAPYTNTRSNPDGSTFFYSHSYDADCRTSVPCHEQETKKTVGSGGETEIETVTRLRYPLGPPSQDADMLNTTQSGGAGCQETWACFWFVGNTFGSAPAADIVYSSTVQHQFGEHSASVTESTVYDLAATGAFISCNGAIIGNGTTDPYIGDLPDYCAQYGSVYTQVSTPWVGESGTAPISLGLVVGHTTTDYSGAVIENTATDFEALDSSNYLNANLLRLPSSVKRHDASGSSILAETDYIYDDPNAGPGSVRGLLTSQQQMANPNLWVATQHFYNPDGTLSYSVDGNGNKTHIDFYDCSGVFPSSVTVAWQSTTTLPETTVSSHDCITGKVTQVRDPNDLAAGGTGTAYTYDSAGNPTGSSSPDGGTVTIDYHNYALPLTISSTKAAAPDPSITSTVSYDGAARVVSTVSGGAEVDTAYDSSGRVASATNPYFPGQVSSGATTFTYDGLGRTTKQTQPDGQTLQWCFSGVASSGQTNCTVSTAYYPGYPWTDRFDESGRHWEQVNDGAGRLLAVIEPDGSTNIGSAPSMATNYQYDMLGNLTSVNQHGQLRNFTYDSLSRLITSTNPETGTICYGQWSGSHCQGGYDANGNLLYKTEANGSYLQYQYDALNRLIKKSGIPNTTQPYFVFDYDPNATYVYDLGKNGIGRLSSESNVGTTGTQFSYDVMGRVNGTSVYYYFSGWGPGMGTHYDLAGNVTQITYPNGVNISQKWNAAGRLTEVDAGPLDQPGTPYISNIQYTAAGSPQSATYGNGVTEALNYNTRLQPCHAVANTPLLPQTSGSGNVYDRSAYFENFNVTGTLEGNCGSAPNNNGNIYAIADNLNAVHTQQFNYDNLNRLTTAHRSDNGYWHTYIYDSFGNMLPTDNNQPASVNNAWRVDPNGTNRLFHMSSGLVNTYQYDAAGYLRSTMDSGIGYNFDYTREGYLRCIDRGGNPCTTGSYLYNGSGERTLAEQYNSTWHEYAYLNGQPMADVDQSGTWTDYIYAGGQKIAKLVNQKPLLHFGGYRDGSINMACGVEGSMSGVASDLSQVVIGTGDRLAYSTIQLNASYGGLALAFTDGTDTGSATDIGSGMPLYFNSYGTISWNFFIASLDAYAGKQISYVKAGIHNQAPAGAFDVWIDEAVLVRANGSVLPIFTGQAGAGVPTFSGTACGAHDMWNRVEVGIPSSQNGVNYYLDDHLGTTQMELSGSGWPVWEGQFTPFGQELDNGQTSMRYKFTGKERDTESGLDYFGARYYASSMGRFMSADPMTVTPARMLDPQQLNLYSYVRNNPLIHVDPTGMIIDDSQLNDKEKKKWQGVQDIANEKDADGNLLHPKLNSLISALQSDSRTFTLENSAMDPSTAGQFTITKFTADGKDFTNATVQLDFKKISGISGLTAADLVPNFNKYEGLLNSPLYKLAETFGHEFAHGVYATNHPRSMTTLQQQMNQRDQLMHSHLPLPPDLINQITTGLHSTEKYAQQMEKIVHGEMMEDHQKKQ